MSTTETGDVQPPQQIELAEQLYAVWVRNSTDPQTCPAWVDLEGDTRMRWRAMAEVYARLELYNTESRIREATGKVLKEEWRDLADWAERQKSATEADLHKQSTNPDGKSDAVWMARTQYLLGAVSAYSRMLELVGKRNELDEEHQNHV